jgi:hypothetical protein
MNILNEIEFILKKAYLFLIFKEPNSSRLLLIKFDD